MKVSRRLIVNADDFGRSAGVNEGVARAREHGIVTSASLMIRWPASGPAASYARGQAGMSLGLHLDLGEWAFRGGSWVSLYEIVDLEDGGAVSAEVERQIAAFRAFAGREPTHLDSHQHVHLREPARTVILEAAGRLSVPLRHFAPAVRHCGRFYGQTSEGEPLPENITVESLLTLLSELPPGLTELGCHPGLRADFDTMYGRERAREVAVLCDPRVREAIEARGISLATFRDAEAATA
jgi:chitin disaccharide deacetylase